MYLEIGPPYTRQIRAMNCTPVHAVGPLDAPRSTLHARLGLKMQQCHQDGYPPERSFLSMKLSQKEAEKHWQTLGGSALL